MILGDYRVGSLAQVKGCSGRPVVDEPLNDRNEVGCGERLPQRRAWRGMTEKNASTGSSQESEDKVKCSVTRG